MRLAVAGCMDHHNPGKKEIVSQSTSIPYEKKIRKKYFLCFFINNTNDALVVVDDVVIGRCE
jgi:hypothetical protein